MGTQIFNDDSIGLLRNSNGNERRLNLICDAVEKLTEPSKVNEMVEELVKIGILTGEDVEILKGKGIYQFQPNKDLKQQIQKHKRENNDQIILDDLEEEREL